MLDGPSSRLRLEEASKGVGNVMLRLPDCKCRGSGLAPSKSKFWKNSGSYRKALTVSLGWGSNPWPSDILVLFFLRVSLALEEGGVTDPLLADRRGAAATVSALWGDSGPNEVTIGLEKDKSG